MIETLIVYTAGLVMGVMAGLLPGISVFVILTIAYPLLISVSPVNVLIFYIITVSLSQYFGSVSATFFSIPGTTSSIPSVIEGHSLLKKGEADKAIMFAAIGSFVGSMFALAITYLFLDYIFYLFTLFDSRIRALLIFAAVLAFIFTGKNKILVNVSLIILGFLLGHVGYNTATNSSFMTFGVHYLYGGIPTIAVMIGVYVIPFIIRSLEEHRGNLDFQPISYSGYWQTLLDLGKYKVTILRSSIIGYLSGFVPGLTYQLGTTIAYYYEKHLRERIQKYTPGDKHSLLAAETANNAGVFSQILPLLMIGIPITGSQALIYDLFSNSGTLITAEFFSVMLPEITIAYLVSAIIGVYLAGKYVNWLSFLFKIDYRYVYYMIILILIAVVYYSGSVIYQGGFYLVITLVMLVLGLVVRRLDTLPLIFAFLLYDPSYNLIWTIMGLYF